MITRQSDARAGRALFGLLALALMAGIFWMSARTSLGFEHKLPVPPGPLGNLAHVILFGGLGYLVARAVDRGAASAGLGVAAGKAALVIVTVYGLSDEVHQFFTPGRTCSVYDVVLDALGAITALLLPRPAGAGRPARWLPSIATLAAAAALATVTGVTRPAPDLLIEDALLALGWVRG